MSFRRRTRVIFTTVGGVFRSAQYIVTRQNQRIDVTDPQVALLPSATISLSANTPTAETTEKHVSLLTSATITLANNAPISVTSEKHISLLSAQTITLTPNSPTAIVTDHQTSLLPNSTITLTANSPTAVTTEKNVSLLPQDHDVVALLNFDEGDSTTTTIDESTYGNTVRYYGAAENTNTQTKFGASSFNGNLTDDDYVEIDYNPAMDAGTGDFTIELWYYPTNSIGGHDYAMHAGQVSNTNRWWLSNNNNTISFNYSSNNGVSINVFKAFGSAGSLNQWHFVTITRSGDTLFAHVDGNKSGLTLDVTGLDFSASVPRNIRIGARDNGISPSVANADAYLDNFRFIVGTALYTEDAYTVPTAPTTTGTIGRLKTVSNNPTVEFTETRFPHVPQVRYEYIQTYTGVFRTSYMFVSRRRIKVTVGDNISLLPSQTITLTSNNPTANVDGPNIVLLASGTVTLTSNNPTAISTDTNFSVVPNQSITLTPNNPTVDSTDNRVSILPSQNITLTPNNSTVNSTDKHISVLPTEAITLTPNNPTVRVGDDNRAFLPSTAVTLTNNAPTVSTTEKHFALLPNQTITLTANNPTVVIAEEETATLPSTEIFIQRNNPTVETTITRNPGSLRIL